MADNTNNNVVRIDPIYIKYRKMWTENRWQFSGDLVRLTIKQSKDTLDNIERYTLQTMNRIINDNNGNWLDGYEWNEGVLKPRKK